MNREPVFAKYMKAEGNTSLPSKEVKKAEEPAKLDFKYLKGKTSLLEVNNEWKKSLLKWFAHLRMNIMNSCSCDKEITYKSVIRSIESGEDPKLDAFGVFDSISSVLEYFIRDQTIIFSKCELLWLFTCLIFIDRLVVDSIAEMLEKIEVRIENQISTSNKSDELYPFLATCSVILTGFFHRS